MGRSSHAFVRRFEIRWLVLCVVTFLALLAFAGCRNPDVLWRLDENRAGYTLEHEDRGEGKFEAKIVKSGDARVLELRNIDRSLADVDLRHTMWLEVDEAGRVSHGLLKRVVESALRKGNYHGSIAKWYKVYDGLVILNEVGEGTLSVRYAIEGRSETIEGEILPQTIERPRGLAE